jgi:hypothetical protein
MIFAMSLPTLLFSLGLLFVLMPLRAEDYLKEAQEQNAPQDASPLVKLSPDHRIKVTLLYTGPVSDKQIPLPFVVVYMVEDCRTAEDLARHHATPTPDGHFIDGGYLLTTYPPDIKDGTGKALPGGQERCREYKGALQADFKTVYPQISLPTPDHPDKCGVFEYFYKEPARSPFDITLHDRIVAYGESSFHFRDISANSFPQ